MACHDSGGNRVDYNNSVIVSRTVPVYYRSLRRQRLPLGLGSLGLR